MSSTSKDEEKEKVLVLRTRDNEEFGIKESAAIQSVTIKNMVDEDCASTVIPLPNVDSKTLTQTIKYLNKHACAEGSKEDLKNFDKEFFDENSMDEIFDIIMAANFLDIKGLLDISCQNIAEKIKNKSPKFVRKLFNIQNDFTPEEEANIRNEHAWAFEGVDPDDE